jgi:hypothetical protein
MQTPHKAPNQPDAAVPTPLSVRVLIGGGDSANLETVIEEPLPFKISDIYQAHKDEVTGDELPGGGFLAASIVPEYSKTQASTEPAENDFVAPFWIVSEVATPPSAEHIHFNILPDIIMNGFPSFEVNNIDGRWLLDELSPQLHSLSRIR